jgi:hypothetical protein
MFPDYFSPRRAVGLLAVFTNDRDQLLCHTLLAGQGQFLLAAGSDYGHLIAVALEADIAA